MADDYTKRLERKIHNQRVRIRWLEGLIEMIWREKAHYAKPKWFEKVIGQGKELRELRQQQTKR